MLHVMDVQVQLYFLLQSLHLVRPFSLPGLRVLVPFGEPSLMQLPPFPADLSFTSISQFCFRLLIAPPVLYSLRGCFRRLVRKRLYRLIRRRLPKPVNAEETSLRVAFENDLIDWIAPSLGRRSEEETIRTHLTLAQDIVNEIDYFKWWALSWIGIKPGPRIDPDRQARGALTQYEQGLESIRHWNEELRDEIGVMQPGSHLSQQRVTELHDLSGEQTPRLHENAGPSFSGPSAPSQTPEPVFDSASTRILSTDEGRISQSPDELSSVDLTEMPPLTRRRSIPPVEPANREARRRDNINSNRRHSRSNTLFSRPSSPESSPPTSPRVRASLIHQNSDIITMQLELLSHRNRDRSNQSNPVDDSQNEILTRSGEPADRRSISELLDALIPNRDQNLQTLPSSNAEDGDTLSGLTTRVSPLPRHALADPVSVSQQNTPQDRPSTDSPAEPPIASIANVLPDDVEEPPPLEPIGTQSEVDRNIDNPLDLQPGPPEESTTARHLLDSAAPHRLTILSSQPVDSLASDLAGLISTVMFFPIESMYIRSLASSCLASQGASPALLSNVRRPFGFWLGGASMSDIIPYVTKLSLAFSLQTVASAAVWGVLTGGIIRFGKIFCGWGSL